MIKEIENPNNHRLQIKPLKYKSDDIDESIPKPLSQCYTYFYYFASKPKGGKTTLLCNLLMKGGAYYRKFDKIYVFSSSLFNGNLVKSIFDDLPDDQKFEHLDELQDVIDDVKKTDDRTLFIFDDIQAEIKGEIAKSFLALCNNRRHYAGGCSIILCSQQFIGGQVSLVLRKSISHLFFWSSKNKKEIDSVWKEYLSFLSEDKLNELLEYVWDKPHNFLLLDVYAAQNEMIYKNFNKIEFNEK
jgi:hypothetical protein